MTPGFADFDAYRRYGPIDRRLIEMKPEILTGGGDRNELVDPQMSATADRWFK